MRNLGGSRIGRAHGSRQCGGDQLRRQVAGHGELGQDRAALGPLLGGAREDRAGPHRAQGPVTAVAISPDGKWLVTGGWDKTPRLWDLSAAEPEKTARVLAGHTEAVVTVAISADGKWLVTGSADRTARLWDLSAAEPEQTARVLAGHTSPVIAVAISADGKWLVTGSADNTARLWDLSAAEPEQTERVLAGHSSPVVAVALSADGKWLVTGSWDKTARLWDLSAAEPEKTERVLAGHTGPVNAVAHQLRRQVARDGELGQDRAAVGPHRGGAGEDGAGTRRAHERRQCRGDQLRRQAGGDGEL